MAEIRLMGFTQNHVTFQFIVENPQFQCRYIHISYTILWDLRDVADIDCYLHDNAKDITGSSQTTESLLAIREYLNHCRCSAVPDIPAPPHSEWRECLATILMKKYILDNIVYQLMILNKKQTYCKFDWHETEFISRLFILHELGFPGLLDIVVSKTQFDFTVQDIANSIDPYVRSDKQTLIALYAYTMQKHRMTKSAR